MNINEMAEAVQRRLQAAVEADEARDHKLALAYLEDATASIEEMAAVARRRLAAWEAYQNA